jgi:hypothetical protein
MVVQCVPEVQRKEQLSNLKRLKGLHGPRNALDQ